MKKQEFYTLEDFVNSGIIKKVTEDTMANIKSGMMEVPKGHMPQHVVLPIFQEKQEERQYMVGLNGEQYGPFVRSQILELLVKGEITKQTLIWRGGMASWVELGDCLDFIGV